VDECKPLPPPPPPRIRLASLLAMVIGPTPRLSRSFLWLTHSLTRPGESRAIIQGRVEFESNTSKQFIIF